MSLPDVVSPLEWLVARKALLAKEKEVTRVRDALNADRRRLPMVKVRKEYVFDGPRLQLRLPRHPRRGRHADHGQLPHRG